MLEGVAFSMKDCFRLLQGAGLGSVSEVRIAGGGAKGALWRKIVASALGLPMVTVNSTEGAAYGAALLGGVGAGAWPTVEAACDATIAVTGRDEPVAEWVGGLRRPLPPLPRAVRGPQADLRRASRADPAQPGRGRAQRPISAISCSGR